ncbi:hypothetical protein BKA70DRAFT_469938 [Coprinopsis sp. MPI-PUGE-AT-0042]|nr:hypothetical protein BKA70DRAFT_469938 [Coprinopsis sp. MPI-PUGE-AT-0042]
MSISSEVPFPVLPEELQCHIFELAADGNLEDAFRLTLVSRGVNARVQPRIFREVVLSARPKPGNITPRALEYKSKQFLTRHVKRLCVPWDADENLSFLDALESISTCTGGGPRSVDSPPVSDLWKGQRVGRQNLQYFGHSPCPPASVPCV